MIALIGSAAAALAVATAITLVWKISVHVGVVAGIIAVFTLLFGWQALVLAPLVALVAWARVALGDHTPAQTVAGGLLGALVGASTFRFLPMILA